MRCITAAANVTDSGVTSNRNRAARTVLALLTAVALVLGLAPGSGAAATRQGSSTPYTEQAKAEDPRLPEMQPLSAVLRSDGSVDPARSDGGSFDAKGYRMTTAPDGEPRFTAEAGAPASAGSDADWATDFGNPSLGSDVFAVAVSGNDVYVGGDFFYSMAGMANHTYNRIAKWDGKGWRRMGEGVNDAVRAIAVVGSHVYVGGDFTTAGHVTAEHLARWDGIGWSPVGRGVSDLETSYATTVNALASDGSRLYVGGTFTWAGSIRAVSLAAFSLSSGDWSAIGGVYRCASCGSDDPGSVNALALLGTTLYVGGKFDQVGTVRTFSFASMNTSTGAWTQYGAGISDELDYTGRVNSIAVDPSSRAVYVGGSFTHAGARRSWNLVRLSGGAFSTLGDFSSYGGKYAEVYSVAVSGGRLYAGGSFTTAGSLAAKHLVVHNGSSWSVPGAALDNVVRTMASKGAGVVVLGDFTTAGTLRVQHGGIWNGSSWESFGQGTTSTAIGSGAVMAVSPIGNGAYVAGRFDQAGSLPVGSIARWTGDRWDAMGGGVKSTIGHGQIYAMVQLGTDLYVAGSFDRAGNVAAKNIARWDGARWHAVGGGANSDVKAMIVHGGKIYVGGKFSTAGGLLVGGLARLDPATNTFSKVGNSPLYDHDVLALAVLNDRYLIVGGTFNGFNHEGVKIVESLYGMAGFDLQATIDPRNVLSGYRLIKGVSRYGAAGWVRSLHVVGSDLYVGGWFDVAGIMKADGSRTEGFSASNMAVWHYATNTWETAGDPDQQVYAIGTAGDDVVVGGWFTTIGGIPAGRVASYSRETGDWSALGSGLGGGENDFVSAEALGHSKAAGLWVGGQFASAGASPSANVARWTGPFGEPRDATLLVAHNGGRIVSAPAGIDCGSVCGRTYPRGTVVTLTATAAAGKSFAGWDGACTGTGTCTVRMDDDRVVVAAFSTAPAPAVSTALRSAVSATKVVYGGTARVSGVLTRSDTRAPLAGRKVALQSLAPGAKSWTAAGTATTTAAGAVTFNFKPAATRSYRLTYAGVGGREVAAVSPVRAIAVQATVTLSASAAKVKKGAKVTFAGTLAPSHAGKVVTLQRYASGRWSAVRNLKLSSTSSFKSTETMTSSVDYIWRVSWAGDADHTAAVSPTKQVVVQ